jgi:hypothetical protein
MAGGTPLDSAIIAAMRACLWLIALTACGRIGIDPLVDGTAVGNAIAFANVTSTTAIDVDGVALQQQVAGTDPILFVVVATRTVMVPSQPVQSVTFGSSTLSSVITSTSADGLDDFEVWVLEAPSPGLDSVTVTLAGTAAGVSASAVTYTGVAQSQAIDDSTSAMGSDDAIFVQLQTSAPATWVLGTCLEQGNATQMFSPEPGQNGRWSDVVDMQSWESQGGADQPASAAGTNTAFAWTIVANPWLAIAVSFKAACAGC